MLTVVWTDFKNYLFQKMCEFLRWIELSEEYWVWLDINIFNGAL